MEKLTTYANKLKNSLVWWLSKRRPFYINDEYSVELVHIDREHESVKIKITNLKTQEIIEQEVDNGSC